MQKMKAFEAMCKAQGIDANNITWEQWNQIIDGCKARGYPMEQVMGVIGKYAPKDTQNEQ